MSLPIAIEPEQFAGALPFWGAMCFGMLIGWFVYYINRYRKSDLQFSDITTLVGVLGGGTVTLLFKGSLFAGYSIGLFVGFFAYFGMLIVLVRRSVNFDSDWFLDGRTKQPTPPFYIPDGTAVTVRPALAPSAVVVAPLQPHATSFRQPPTTSPKRDVDDDANVELTIVLKPAMPFEPSRHIGGRGLSRDEFRARHRTSQDAIERVIRYTEGQGLRTIRVDSTANFVQVAGSYRQARSAFRPEHLAVYEINGKEYVGRSGYLYVPSDLANDVVAVTGFDQRPVVRPHFRVGPAAASNTSYNPADIATRYGFPSGTGTGQTIALLEFGGGYSDADVATYFQATGVTRTGTLEAVPVDAANAPDGVANGPDVEVQLDIDVAGAVAPGANLVVYFAANQMASFVRAISAAVHDETRSPSVISLSWGAAENSWSTQDRTAIDQALQAAAALNVTVCVASGDHGATDGATDGSFNVDFPASSPHALGCGGTSLPNAGAEVAWNNNNGWASGGGYSQGFPLPFYQVGTVQNAMRGLPDVAGDADGNTGYNIRVDGGATVAGGTSAVAPLWAALTAIVNANLQTRVGFMTPLLYAAPSAFNDITAGDNNGYSTSVGWDPVTGLGSPVGTTILAALQRGVGVPAPAGGAAPAP